MTLKEFFNSKETIAIHCFNENQAKILLKEFDKLGKTWNYYGESYLENNLYYVYGTDTCYTNKGTFTNVNYLIDSDIKIYDFYHIEFFIIPKEKEETRNAIRRRCDIFDDNDDNKECTLYSPKKIYPRCKFSLPYNFFTINSKKKTIFLKLRDNEITIKCHEEDKFDWKIGLGLALSNINAIDENKAKWHREYFRNKKTHKLDYKKYANWVLVEYYKNDYEDIDNLQKRVECSKDNEKIYL